MIKKKTEEKAKEIVESLGYELISMTDKNGNKTKLILKDHENYYYLARYNHLKEGHKPNRFSSSNPYTLQNIKLWCKLERKSFTLLSREYHNNSELLQWQCLVEGCEEIFENCWGNIYFGQGCGYCSGKQVGISNCLATLNPELAKEWHPTLNGDLTPYNITVNSNKDIWWQCKDTPKHVWSIKISSRNGMKTGCPYCSHSLPSEDYNLLVDNPKLCEEWNYEKNDKRPDEYLPGHDKKVWWKCKECNHEWEAVVYSRNKKEGRGNGCPECNKSKGEKECKRVFIENGFVEINMNQDNFNNSIDKDICTYFIPQKTFEELVGMGGGLLSYDFYLPKYNLLVEYQGEYHDQVILNYKNEPRELAEARLIKQKEHDKRKKEYTEQNEYNFLEIWYWDYDSIEIILNEYINNLEIDR